MYVFISRSFPGIGVGQDPLALSLSLSRSLSLSLFALLCSGPARAEDYARTWLGVSDIVPVDTVYCIPQQPEALRSKITCRPSMGSAASRVTPPYCQALWALNDDRRKP